LCVLYKRFLSEGFDYVIHFFFIYFTLIMTMRTTPLSGESFA